MASEFLSTYAGVNPVADYLKQELRELDLHFKIIADALENVKKNLNLDTIASRRKYILISMFESRVNDCRYLLKNTLFRIGIDTFWTLTREDLAKCFPNRDTEPRDRALTSLDRLQQRTSRIWEIAADVESFSRH